MYRKYVALRTLALVFPAAPLQKHPNGISASNVRRKQNKGQEWSGRISFRSRRIEDSLVFIASISEMRPNCSNSPRIHATVSRRTAGFGMAVLLIRNDNDCWFKQILPRDARIADLYRLSALVFRTKCCRVSISWQRQV